MNRSTMARRLDGLGLASGAEPHAHALPILWRCPSCAFDNPARFLCCDVCSRERPPDSLAVPLSQDPVRGPDSLQTPTLPAAEPPVPSLLAKEICQHPKPCPRKSVSPVLAAYCDKGPRPAADQATVAAAESSRFPSAGVAGPGVTSSGRGRSMEVEGYGGEAGGASPLERGESRRRDEGEGNSDGAQPDFLGALYGLRLVEAEPFLFDSPSPDDQVRAAQSKGLLRPTKHTATVAVRSRSKPGAKPAPPPPPSSVPASQAGSSNPLAPTALQNGNGQERGSGGAQEPLPVPHGEGPSVSCADVALATSAHVAGATSARGRPLGEYKEEKWLSEAAARAQGEKPTVHVLVMGHVDAGKSTLAGHLLHDLGLVPAKDMHRNRREAAEQGKGSFAFAWVMDEGSEERRRGVTMTLGLAALQTPRLHVNLLDAPGHRDFVPSMISGAAQADAAVLVVDATPGALEAGLWGTPERQYGGVPASGQGRGQTWEHCQLARGCGVEQLIVAVNKMDAVGYSEAAFEAVKAKLGPVLRQTGFKNSLVMYVPVSASEGENLTKVPESEAFRTWYACPTLLGALDSLAPPVRDPRRPPLRFPVSEVLPKTRTLGPAAVSGKIESGGLKPGLKVLVMPGGQTATVKALEGGGGGGQGGSKGVKEALAGSAVDVGLTGVEASGLFPGAVLCHPDFPVPAVRKLRARILTLHLKIPILRGAAVTLHVHCAAEAAVVSHLEALLDPKTGDVIKQRPRVLPSNSSALVQISVERPVCVELYASMKSLGCIAIRDGGRTLAVGIITELLPDL